MLSAKPNETASFKKFFHQNTNQNCKKKKESYVLAEFKTIPTLFVTSTMASATIGLLALVCSGETSFRSGIVALSVCAIATSHYIGIFFVRYKQNLNEQSSELLIDIFRHSDWLITLPLLHFELFELVYFVEPRTKETFISPLVAALLQILVVLLGAIGRFYSNQIIGFLTPKRMIGTLSYLGSMIIWIITTVNFLNFTTSEKTRTPEQNWIIDWCIVLILLQCGYPIVTLMQITYETLYANKIYIDFVFSDYRYFAKDFAYSFLDVASKASLLIVLTFNDLE